MNDDALTQSGGAPANPPGDGDRVRPARAAVFWLVILVGTGVVILAGGEILARLTYSLAAPIQVAPVQAVGSEEAALTPEENRLGFRGDPELMWRLRTNVRFPDHLGRPLRGIVSNSQALREPAALSRDKEPNELRVLFLGDSITFGWQLLHDETFSSRAARVLRESIPGVAFTPLNAGVPGHSLLQGWRLLMTEGFDYEPDLVVLGSFGFNGSSSWRNISDFEQLERWQARLPIAPLRWSRLAQLIAARTHSVEYRPIGDRHRPRLLPSEFSDLLERIRMVTEERDVELLVVVPAHENNVNGIFPVGERGPYQRILTEFGKTQHLGLIEEPAMVDAVILLQELAREHDLSDLLFDHVHPTQIFHAALGDAIAGRIAPWVETLIEFRLLEVDGVSKAALTP